MNNYSVLIVDDDREFCVEMKDLLEGMDLNVKTAYTGWEAMPIAKQGVNLIVFDIILPDFSGYYFINILKTTEETKNVPVFVISALNDLKYIKKAKDIGVSEYFTKPIEPHRFIQTVNEYINKI